MTETYQQAERRFRTARDRSAGLWVGGRRGAWGIQGGEARLYGHGRNFFIRIGNIDVVQITPRDTWILRGAKWRSQFLLWAMNYYSPGFIESDRSGQWVLRNDSPFYSGVEIDFHGLPIKPTPKKIARQYTKLANEHRLDQNEVTRAYARSVRAHDRLSDYRFGKCTDLPITDFPHLRNVEDRKQFIEIVGLAKILEHYNAKVLDADAARGYKLLAISDEDLIPEYDRRPGVRSQRQRDGEVSAFVSRDYHYLQMRNPSTGEIHIEGVRPECLTLADALQFRNGSAETPTVLT